MLEVVEEVPFEAVERVVLRLLAIFEIEGPTSANTFAFERFLLYWTSSGNCQRLAVVCSKLWLINWVKISLTHPSGGWDDSVNCVRKIYCGVSSQRKNARAMLTMHAFLDDSGSDWKSPPRQGEVAHYVLAGHLSAVPHWEVFADQWQHAIDGPPQLEYFKASEAQSLKFQFDGWNDEQRDGLILRLARIIEAATLLRIQVALPQNLYDQYIKGKIPERWDNPYFMCLLRVVEIVAFGAHRLARPGTTKIDFIFDEQQKLKKQAEAVFEFYKGTRIPFAEVIGKISHEDEVEFLPLQAADLEAWLTRRELAGYTDVYRDCFAPIRSLDPVRYVIGAEDLKHFMKRFWENLQIMNIPELAKRPKLHPFFDRMIVR
jgi:hypothetical protein